jgi:hypothetical protein
MHFRPARNRNASVFGKAVHAAASRLARIAFICTQASRLFFRFGVLPSASISTGRSINAQSGCPSTAASEPNCSAICCSAQSRSGCPSFGSLLTVKQPQSATRHRQAGCPSAGGQRTTKQHHGSQASGRISGNVKGVAMPTPNINSHRQLARVHALYFTRLPNLAFNRTPTCFAGSGLLTV